jgi:hypothetical protein
MFRIRGEQSLPPAEVAIAVGGSWDDSRLADAGDERPQPGVAGAAAHVGYKVVRTGAQAPDFRRNST